MRPSQETSKKNVHLDSQHTPLILTAICIWDGLARNPVTNPRDLSYANRLHVEGVPIHNPIVRRDELGHSPNP